MSRIAGFMLACLLVAGSAWAQDWRGNGRMTGKVVDEKGKGLEGVVVQAKFPSVLGAVLQAQTDKNGQWNVDDVGEGSWEISFELGGYFPGKASVEVDESGRSSPVKTTLKKKFDPNEFIQEEGKKATALIEQKKYAEARAIYESIIAKVPEVSGQMQQFVARTFYLEGQPAKAAERLKLALAKDPANAQTKRLLVTMLLEAGTIDEAAQVAGTLDESTITDNTMWVSFGVALVKKQQAADALPYFDKAIAKFPQASDAYYYRALALIDLVNAQKDPKDAVRIERLGKVKADLTKYLELTPNGPEADNVKKLLEQVAKQ